MRIGMMFPITAVASRFYFVLIGRNVADRAAGTAGDDRTACCGNRRGRSEGRGRCLPAAGDPGQSPHAGRGGEGRQVLLIGGRELS